MKSALIVVQDKRQNKASLKAVEKIIKDKQGFDFIYFLACASEKIGQQILFKRYNNIYNTEYVLAEEAEAFKNLGFHKVYTVNHGKVFATLQF